MKGVERDAPVALAVVVPGHAVGIGTQEAVAA